MYNIISPDEETLKEIIKLNDFSNNIEENENFLQYLKIAHAENINLSEYYHKSKYNVVSNNGQKCIIYNTLYNSMAELDGHEYKQFNGKIGTDEVTERFFVENGFWIDEKIDEIKTYIELANLKHRNSRPDPTLILTTTLKCNARCSYCYEKGVEQKSFPVDKIDSLVDFIKKLEWKRNINITWFGGEPLMNTKFIDELSQRLRENGIPYISSMITNGSLITDDMIREKFFLWNLRHVQITLDGTSAEYKRIKNYINEDIGKFENIINNIENIATNGVSVNVRVNIDKNNIDDVKKLFLYLELKFSNSDKIRYYPAFIDATENDVPEDKREDVLLEIFHELKYPAKLMAVNKLHNRALATSCHRHQINAYSIDVDGNVYRCEHDVGHAENKLGDVVDGVKYDTRDVPQSLRDTCRACVYLPKCYGGCESNYLKNASPCMIDKYIIPAYMKIMLEY